MHAGQEAVSDSAHTVVNCLVDLVQYPHMMVMEIFSRNICISILSLLCLLVHAIISIGTEEKIIGLLIVAMPFYIVCYSSTMKFTNAIPFPFYPYNTDYIYCRF